jgi:methylated-DNA-[protein]-cysteine S-methyltransferase
MNPKHYFTEFSSPLGTLRLFGTDEAIIGVFMDRHPNLLTASGGARRDGSPLRTARDQIEEFLAGQRRMFDLRLEMRGTPFQKRVWRQLLAISYGETKTYGAVATSIGCPGAARAVGAANRGNPLSIIVPCHRVIAACGAISGYGGGIERKRFLLALEREHSPVERSTLITMRGRE